MPRQRTQYSNDTHDAGTSCMMFQPERRAVSNPAINILRSCCPSTLSSSLSSYIVSKHCILSGVYLSSFVLATPFLCHLLSPVLHSIFLVLGRSLSLAFFAINYCRWLMLRTNSIDKGSTTNPHDRRCIHDNLPLFNL